MPSVAEIRAWFPSLSNEFAYLENAGGSQVPGVVADAVRDYMLSSYVQLGAGYEHSRRASETNASAHAFIETFMNAETVGKVVLGPSTTALTTILAASYGETMQPGDEVIIAETNHEANAGPWARLERYGAKIRIWKVDPDTFECSLDTLKAMLNDRTRIVAFPHVSNLLGHIVDVKAITEAAHQVGARVVADGVAYAPHRAIDVAEWGVDWYIYSTYKVFGPHMAALFGRHECFQEVTGPNHYFIPRTAIPQTFELGGASHEGCAGLLGLRPYLRFLAGREADDRQTVVRAFEVMEQLETPLQARIVEFLKSKPGVKVIGKASPEPTSVGTISFLSDKVASDVVTAHTDARGVGIRSGHMYAYRLCESLGIPTVPGVVRISLAHYNTEEEIERLIAALDVSL